MLAEIWAIASKDLRVFSRDRLGLFFAAGFPVIYALFFGMIFASSMGGDGPTRIPIAVVDEDGSGVSRSFVAALQQDKRLEVRVQSREQGIGSVRRKDAAAVLVLPRGFGETAGVFWLPAPRLPMGADPSRTAEGGLLQGVVLQSLGALAGERMQSPEVLRSALDQGREQIAGADDIPAPLKLALQGTFAALDGVVAELDRAGDEPAAAERGLRGPEFRLAEFEELDVTASPGSSAASALSRVRSPWDISFPQSMCWGVLGCVAGFATLVVRERMTGTHLRLRAAPIPPSLLMAGKALACGVSVLAIIAVMTILGCLLGMRPERWDLYVLSAAATAWCFTGLMTVLAWVGQTEQAVAGAVWGANTLMAMLGGGMIPLAFMPPSLRSLSHLSPIKWSVISLEGAIWRGFSPGEMLPPMAVLGGVGALGFAIGAWLSRRAAAG